MAKFAIGEIAIVLGGKDRPTAECEIMALPGHIDRYLIKVDGGKSRTKTGWWAQREWALRKKKPPKEALGSWQEVDKIINWNPTKEKAHA